MIEGRSKQLVLSIVLSIGKLKLSNIDFEGGHMVDTSVSMVSDSFSMLFNVDCANRIISLEISNIELKALCKDFCLEHQTLGKLESQMNFLFENVTLQLKF